VLSAGAAELRDVEFARPAGAPLTLDAYWPEAAKPQPAVILVHGGGWEAGGKRTYIRPWLEELTARRIAWFSIEYRLAPRFKHPAALEDVEAAVAWIRANAARFSVDPERLALMGESAGGHLASLAALRGKVRVRTAISFYGIHDIPLWSRQRGEMPKNIGQYLGGSDPWEASPIRYVSAQSPPMLLIHGEADQGVPPGQSTVLCDALRRAGRECELLLIPGAPHGVENWEGQAEFQGWRPALLRWLRRHL
jgi:alpha-L-fucosidase 2